MKPPIIYLTSPPLTSHLRPINTRRPEIQLCRHVRTARPPAALEAHPELQRTGGSPEVNSCLSERMQRQRFRLRRLLHGAPTVSAATQKLCSAEAFTTPEVQLTSARYLNNMRKKWQDLASVLKLGKIGNRLNPRTDGGPGHLSTDGGGADNRLPEISKTKQARDKR